MDQWSGIEVMMHYRTTLINNTVHSSAKYNSQEQKQSKQAWVSNPCSVTAAKMSPDIMTPNLSVS